MQHNTEYLSAVMNLGAKWWRALRGIRIVKTVWIHVFLFLGSETRQLGSESRLRAEGQLPLAFWERGGGNVLRDFDWLPCFDWLTVLTGLRKVFNSVCVSEAADIGLWLGKACRSRDDWLCCDKMVQSTWGYFKLDALQPDRQDNTLNTLTLRIASSGLVHNTLIKYRPRLKWLLL